MADHGKSFTVHLDAIALARYERISRDMGRSIEDLIEIAAEEAALEYAKQHGLLVPVRTDEPSASDGPCGMPGVGP